MAQTIEDIEQRLKDLQGKLQAFRSRLESDKRQKQQLSVEIEQAETAYSERSALFEQRIQAKNQFKQAQREASLLSNVKSSFSKADIDKLLSDMALLRFIQLRARALSKTVVQEIKSAKSTASELIALIPVKKVWGTFLSALTEADSRQPIDQDECPKPETVTKIVLSATKLIPFNSEDVGDSSTLPNGVTLNEIQSAFDFSQFLAAQFPEFTAKYTTVFGQAPVLSRDFNPYLAMQAFSDPTLQPIKQTLLTKANNNQTFVDKEVEELSVLYDKLDSYAKTLSIKFDSVQRWQQQTVQTQSQLIKLRGNWQQLETECRDANISEASLTIELRKNRDNDVILKRLTHTIPFDEKNLKQLENDVQWLKEEITKQKIYQRYQKNCIALKADIEQVQQVLFENVTVANHELVENGVLSNDTITKVSQWLNSMPLESLFRQSEDLKQAQESLQELDKQYTQFRTNFLRVLEETSVKKRQLKNEPKLKIEAYKKAREVSWGCYFRDILEQTFWGESAGEIRNRYITSLISAAKGYRKQPTSENYQNLQSIIQEGHKHHAEEIWFEPSIKPILAEVEQLAKAYEEVVRVGISI